jgi:ATP-binding cassette subfamily B protein IrtB
MYGTLKKIFAFAGSKEGLLKKSLLFAFLSGLFAALQFAALFIVVEALVSDNRDSRFIWISLGIMAVSLVGRIITTYFSTMEQTETGYCMVAEKRIHIGDRLRYIPMGYFNKNSIGNITAIVTTTLGDVENSAARVLVSVLGGFFNSVALVIVLLVFDWRIGLIAAIGVLLYLAAAELALRKSARLSGVRQHTQESLVESVLEYIQGMGIVKAFGMEKDSTQSIDSVIKASCRDNLKLTKASVPYDALKQVVVRVFSVLLLLASIYFWLNGSLSLAYGVILVIASFMVFNDLENAGNMASLLQMLAASMDTANSIDDTPVMDEKGADVVPVSSEIVFDNVDFSYKVNGCGADREGGLGHADRKILDHVSFTIPAGTTTAIVGPSGSGKTTMCNLIARFWDVDAGRITVGGKDVRDFKLDSLMKNIGMVFQNVYLFADSIENNIKFGCPDATHEQVVEAAKKACCHEFISALPDGYDTLIGEGGGTLSGGEKQRISIARAILKNAPIIILDEATSSVDPENEEELQRAIAELTHDKTIIMIAHRLKTVRGADQILVLDDSHIVQSGTHAELIQQKGLYADFVSAKQEAIGWKLAQ